MLCLAHKADVVPQVVFAPGALLSGPALLQPSALLCWPCQMGSWDLLCTLGAMARGETLSLKERTLWSSSCQPGLRLSPAHLHYTYCMSRADQSIASVAGLTVSLPRSLWTLGPWPHASSAGPAWQCLGSYLLTTCSRVVLSLALQLQDVLTPLLSLGKGALCAAVSACSPLTACIWHSACWRGCEKSHGVSLPLCGCVSEP